MLPKPIISLATRMLAHVAVVASMAALSACSMPPLPDNTPTVQEVPFLGQQLTQPQIDEWRGKVTASRDALRQTLAQDKVACYQRFLVNRCLRQSRERFNAQDAILRKQELELNRQERLLKEVDRQLRLQQKAHEVMQ